MSELLDDYIPKDAFAKELKVSSRTVDRYREEGLPAMVIAGEVWIHKPGARQWIADRLATHTKRMTRSKKALDQARNERASKIAAKKQGAEAVR